MGGVRLRLTSGLTCLIMLVSILLPGVAYAFTLGPWQPDEDVLLGKRKVEASDFPTGCESLDEQYLMGLYKDAWDWADDAVSLICYELAARCHGLRAIIGYYFNDMSLVDGPLYSIGNLKCRLNDHEAAIKYFTVALEIAKQQLDYELVGKIYNDMGVAYVQLGQLNAAETYYIEALKIREKLQDPLGQGRTYNNLGKLYIEKGDEARGIENLEKAREKLREAGDNEGLAAVLVNLGAAYTRMGQYEKAFSVLEEAYNAKKDLKDINGAILVLNNIGNIYAELGRFQKAKEYYHRAYDSILKYKDEEIRPDRYLGLTLDNLGTASANLGYLKTAIEYFLRAKEEREKDKDKKGLSKTLNNLGCYYYTVGAYGTALKYFQESLKIKQRLWDYEGIIVTRSNIGLVYNALGNPKDALIQYEKAKEWVEKKGYTKLLGEIYNNIAGAYLDSGDMGNAGKYYELAVASHKENEDYIGLAITYANLGAFEETKGNHPAAVQYYIEALNLFNKLGLLSRAGSCLGNLARLCEATGNDQGALDYFEKALKTKRDTNDKPGEANVQGNIGRYYRKQGEPEIAVTYFKEAFAIWEELASGLTPESGLQEGLRSEQVEYACDLVEVLVELGKEEEAFLICERSKAQTLSQWISMAVETTEESAGGVIIAKLKRINEDIIENKKNKAHDRENADIYDKKAEELQTELIEAKAELAANYPIIDKVLKRDALTIEDVCARLSEWNEYVIHFVCGPDRVTVLAGGPGGLMDAYSVPVSELGISSSRGLSTTEKNRPGFAKQIATLKGSSMGPAETLQMDWYEALLEPVLSKIPSDANLLICPDGPLYELPFEALRNPNGKRFLIEDHQVRYAPSVTLAGLFNSGSSGAGEPVVVGISDYSVYSEETELPSGTKVMEDLMSGERGADDFEWISLPKAEIEAGQIYDALCNENEGKLFEAGEADEASVKSYMPNARILHYATHGYVSPYLPDINAIVLLPGGGEDGYLTLGEVAAMNLDNCELVFLSACDTAKGELTSGEGIFGLAQGFLVAGSDCVIGSLWSIDDDAALEVGENFYKFWIEGKSPAEALRLAKVEFIEDPSKSPNPQLWASLVIYGGYLGQPAD